ncbi:MAG: translocation/assembly module TamB [Nitrospirae bacterium]|nr:translocation/assembly module TamB [Nitrospirota bacterium]
MENTKRKNRIIYSISAAFLIGIIIFISRGPYISNALKKMILPELENMTGRKVIAQKIYLNIFPLFVEAKGLKVFDEQGNKVLTVERVKGYLKFWGFLKKEAGLRRIVINEPEVWTNREQIDDIISNCKKYLAKEDPKKIKVRADAIEVRHGAFSFQDDNYNLSLAGRHLSGEILLGETPRLKAHIKELISNIKNMPELRSEIEGILSFREKGIDIKNITVRSFGSEIKTAGFYSAEGNGALKTDINLIVDSVKRLFGLKRRGEGKIDAKGDVRFEDGSPFFDIKLKGNFYLQTLMELLSVKEKVEGMVDFEGGISGAIKNITGSAEARLRKGNLFGVAVDELKCRVMYSDGVMQFQNGKAKLYNGYADAEASMKLPGVEDYSVKVNFTDVDSRNALKLIGWQPEIPEGKVKGEMHTSGKEFNPSGWFDYESRKAGDDVLGRVKKIKGDYKVQGDILSLYNTEARTERSFLGIQGTVDIKASVLDLKGRLETSDIKDLTFPHFNRLHGSGVFEGAVTGRSGDPQISGKLDIPSASFDDYGLGKISGEVSYRKNFLDVTELSAHTEQQQCAVKGFIRFDEAKEIFDLRKPFYGLTASLKGIDFEKLAEIVYRKLPIKGRLDSKLKITGNGPTPEYSGRGVISDATAYGFQVDSISGDFSYNYMHFILSRTMLKKGASSVLLEGMISEKENFLFKAYTEKLFLRDIGLEFMPEDAVISLNTEGIGTFDNPAINLRGKISGGKFRGKSLGDGVIDASVKDRHALLNAMFFDGKIKIKGIAYFDDKLPWSAEVDVLAGRYDFLLSGLLKDIPEDLLLNMKGHANLTGDRKHYSGSAFIDQMTVSLFDHSFSNASDIKLKFEDRKMSFTEFTMRSGDASFKVKGDVDTGREYNIFLEGKTALAPLKGFSEKISVLRGDADFKLDIAGKWDNPRISGNLNVTNGLFGLKDVYQRISSISAYIYFEEDRVIIQKLSGKLSGGDINIAGILYLKRFALKRFYLDAQMNNITTSVSRDFVVNFDGNIICKGTPESQNISGDMKIKRARYRERVEWKSWLLKARPKEKPKAEPTKMEKTVLNVRIYGTENIIVDNNIARTPMKVDMILRGTIGHPLLFGRIESREGNVYFRNNEFRILNVSADFTDPNRINPIVEIVAQITVKGYNIKLSLEGQFQHFTLSLISDPPLEETDILSLLAVGQIGKELKGLEGGIGASEATAFLTGKVQDVFEERLRNITGLDRVQVDPYVSKSTGTVGPRVTVSKRLIGERLFVTYISAVGSTEEQVLRLEYLLGKNVSLVGVRDEKGSMGGDIKFRFEFK